MEEATIENVSFDMDQLGSAIADPSRLELAHNLLSQSERLGACDAQAKLIEERAGAFKSGNIAALGSMVHGSCQPCMMSDVSAHRTNLRV